MDQAEMVSIDDSSTGERQPLTNAPQRNHEPQTPNPNPETPNSKPQTPNPKFRWRYVFLAFHVVLLFTMVTGFASSSKVTNRLIKDVTKKIDECSGEMSERKAPTFMQNETYFAMECMEMIKKLQENSLPQPYEPAIAGQTLQVYEQELTTSQYLYQENLPEMTEMTMCFWFYGVSGTEFSNRYLLTILYPMNPVQGEVILRWFGNKSLSFWFYPDQTTIIEKEPKDDWLGWHKHCFTWKAKEEIKWYRSKDSHGFMELMAAVPVNFTSTTIYERGYLTLLQKQEDHGGDLDMEHTLPGKIAEFNMWDFKMSANQLNTKTCGVQGNVASWNTLQQKGSNRMTSALFPPCNAVKTYTLQVYTQERSISDYRYQNDLPGMSELTTCFWYQISGSATRKGGFLINIGSMDNPNEFAIGWASSGNLSVVLRGVSFKVRLTTEVSASRIWSTWHRHCFTWKVGASFKWYTDQDGDGVLDVTSSVDVTNESIRSGGTLVLLQSRNHLAIDMDINLVASGKVGDFNMWDYEMSQQQINSKTCGKKGNVASDDTLKQEGTLPVTDQTFPGCQDNR